MQWRSFLHSQPLLQAPSGLVSVCPATLVKAEASSQSRQGSNIAPHELSPATMILKRYNVGRTDYLVYKSMKENIIFITPTDSNTAPRLAKSELLQRSSWKWLRTTVCHLGFRWMINKEKSEFVLFLFFFSLSSLHFLAGFSYL